MDSSLTTSAHAVLTPAGLGQLLDVLADDGRELVGPTVRGGAIVIDPIAGIDDLPCGWGDEQEPGRYALRQRQDGAYFGFAAPAGGWKRHLFPARSVLWRSRRDGRSMSIEVDPEPTRPMAFIGIRGCDLAAIGIQDKVFLSRGNPDPIYSARRANLFLVAVNCSAPADTCFCDSMGVGPTVESGADITLTEIDPGDPANHRFIARALTAAGQGVLAEVMAVGGAVAAAGGDMSTAEHAAACSRELLRKRIDPTGIPELIESAAADPVWADTAERCLSCGNCTLACPTCFCSDIDDLPDVVSGTQERVRTWASCFELDHSFIHGGEIRPSVASRYRQWLTHKFSSWWDQFGNSGCVGCGRCVTWCPVGIDVVESIAQVKQGREEALAGAEK